MRDRVGQRDANHFVDVGAKGFCTLDVTTRRPSGFPGFFLSVGGKFDRPTSTS